MFNVKQIKVKMSNKNNVTINACDDLNRGGENVPWNFQSLERSHPLRNFLSGLQRVQIPSVQTNTGRTGIQAESHGAIIAPCKEQ